ncbi:coordinated expression to IRX2 [Phyllostomus discolor]|uniref:Coordinated expression to IRX2 n=1 Tax=Phyllostomus discolor TaxID=89673 RepID=A0A834ENF9_9CHIR|nr:coordinated expression to IRX2 [Phyllostomus discolor]
MMGGGYEGTGSLSHPGGGVRGSYFHLPGSTPLHCGRRPAWPRVWSPAPRHSASPRGTRIRGAFAANCQESPEWPMHLEQGGVKVYVSRSRVPREAKP